MRFGVLFLFSVFLFINAAAPPSLAADKTDQLAMSLWKGRESAEKPAVEDPSPPSASTKMAPIEITPDDRILGSADAPITIVEYASLTCSHCATFHTTVLPQLKKEYIATGRVRLVFRDFPFDPYALSAAVLARCADPDRYFGLLDILFKNQPHWTHAQDPMKSLEQMGALAGVTPQAFEACRSEKTIEKKIAQIRLDAETLYGVDSTPTVIIQGEDKIEGAQAFEVYKKVIDRLLVKP